MKKIAASVGLIALGASALHAAETSTLNKMQQTKPWSLQASLRGFYDDNVGTSPDGPNKVESSGFEINPAAKYGMISEQTSFNLGYDVTVRYFDKPQLGQTDRYDYTHSFDADVEHTFNSRLSLRASESFVIGQEPDRLRDFASTQRVDGNNVRNFASLDVNLEVTQLLGFEVGYDSAYYNYKDSTPVTFGPLVLAPSTSGLLDRTEHSFHIDSRWKLRPQTVGILGYRYSQTLYNSDEVIAGSTAIPSGPGSAVTSESRDSRGHTFYVGVEHAFTPTLSGSLQIGGQYFDFYNDPAGETTTSPYILSSVRYAYQTTTTFDMGFRFSQSAANESGTSLGGAGGTAFIRNTETKVVYATVRHEILSKLFGTASATVQRAEYNGTGPIDGKGFTFYQLGVGLAYQITPNFAATANYSYDELDSELVGRDYDRNRVSIGVTAGF